METRLELLWCPECTWSLMRGDLVSWHLSGEDDFEDVAFKRGRKREGLFYSGSHGNPTCGSDTANWRVLEGPEVLPSWTRIRPERRCADQGHIWGLSLQDIWQKTGHRWTRVRPTGCLQEPSGSHICAGPFSHEKVVGWFPRVSPGGGRVWFGGVVGYCTHSLLSQHTHSHLTHTHTLSGIKWWLLPQMWGSHSYHELPLCWTLNHHVWPPVARLLPAWEQVPTSSSLWNVVLDSEPLQDSCFFQSQNQNTLSSYLTFKSILTFWFPKI